MYLVIISRKKEALYSLCVTLKENFQKAAALSSVPVEKEKQAVPVPQQLHVCPSVTTAAQPIKTPLLRLGPSKGDARGWRGSAQAGTSNIRALHQLTRWVEEGWSYSNA